MLTVFFYYFKHQRPSTSFSYPTTSNEPQLKGYQPYRFDSNQMPNYGQQRIDHLGLYT